MSIQNLCDRLRVRLKKRGAADEYVQSLLEELEDHYRQSIAAGRTEEEALAALGDEDEILQTTIHSLRRDSWLGRHRVLAFVIAPILFYPLAIMVVGLPIGFLSEGLFKHALLPRNGLMTHIWKWTILGVFNFALPICGFLMMRALCRRFRCGPVFATVACGLTVAWTLAAYTAINLPKNANGRVNFVLGAGVGWPLTAKSHWILLCFYGILLFPWMIRRFRFAPRLAILGAGILLSAITLTGCASDTGRIYVARGAVATTRPTLGQTALMIQTDGGGWKSPKVSQENIRVAVTQVLTRVSGTSVTDLPSPPQTSDLSDYELVMAGRAAHAKTVCYIKVDSMGSRIEMGVGIPPYWAGSYARYSIRVLDTDSGKLLVDAIRYDSTFHPLCEPPEHAVIDMQRGLNGVLEREGLLPTVGEDPRIHANLHE